MADLSSTYRILIRYTRNDGVVLGEPGDIKTFEEWAKLLYGRFPDYRTRFQSTLDQYNGSSLGRPQWFQVVTAGGLPVLGEYHVSAAVSGLPNARVSQDTANIVVDNTTPGQVSWDLTTTGVTPGAYTAANVTVDEYGRIVLISSGGGGTGDVVGPASSTNNNVPQWDGTTGKLLKDGLGVSQGGNGASDANKLVQFKSDGGIEAATGLLAGPALYGETGALNQPGVQGYSTNGGEGGRFQSVGGDGVSGSSDDGAGLRGTNSGTTNPPLHVNNTDATNTAPLGWLHNVDDEGLEVQNDGGLDWTTPTGAQTTLTNLGATAVGTALFTVVTPAGVRFIRVNADGTITLRTAAELLADIGGQASGSYLVTTNNLSDVANAATARTNLGLAIGTNVQAYDADLQAISGLTSAANKIIQYTGAGTAQLVDLELGTEAAYSGTITWTASSAPSGSSNLRQFFTRVGNMVTWQISLQYASAGTAVTNLSLTFPTEFPTPVIPAGFSGANARIAGGDPLRLLTSITSSVLITNALCVSRNAADNGFVIAPTTTFTSGNYAAFIMSGQYFTA